jgi:hypothetical protein
MVLGDRGTASYASIELPIENLFLLREVAGSKDLVASRIRVQSTN